MTVTEPARDAQAVEMVDLTIDDVPISVPKGTLVIRAAELIGIQIPRFCDHPLLDPVGACRQCLVEVEGQRKPMASCTITCTPDMVVRTQNTSESADKAQQGVMELLLINHPLDCPVCDKGGECPLQNQAMSNGRAETRFLDVKRTFPKPIPISTEVLLDRERCVLCARCTRFSQQIAGDPFIELLERGALQQVGIAPGEPFSSYFSGNTVQICPVGALTGTAYRFRARPFDLVSSPSVCEHCADGCAQRTDHRRGKVLRRLAGDDPQVNEEWNCDKGRWAFTYATSRRPHRHAADPRRRRQAAVRVVGGGPSGGRNRAGGRSGPRRCAGRRPVHRRGRLRVLEVRPDSLGHQRHRLPDPATQRGGGRVPRRQRRRADDERQLHRPGERARGRARRPRAGRGIPDRVPAVAQGGPQERGAGARRRPVRHPRADQDVRQAHPHRTRRRGGRARRTRRRGAAESARRGHPGGRAACDIARSTLGGKQIGCGDRRPAGLGSAPCRRPRRAGSRRAAEPASGRAPGRRRVGAGADCCRLERLRRSRQRRQGHRGHPLRGGGR